MKLKNVGWFAIGLIVVAVCLGLWWLASYFELVSRVFLPSPIAVFRALYEGWTGGTLQTQTATTLSRMLVGWGLSCMLGVVLGAMIGLSESARAYLQPSLELIRPLPSSAIVPVAISFFGLTNGMVMTVICFNTLWPVLLATIYGVSAVDERLREVSQTLEMSRREYLFKITLPNALPDIIAGMRLSISIALILTILGELLASVGGLGEFIMFSSRFFRSDDLYAGVLLLGVIGYLTSSALRLVEDYLLRYRN